MKGDQQYIVRLLRHVESRFMEEGSQTHAGILGQIIQRVSRADDVTSTLQSLYAVRGMDQFALRLLWYADRIREFGGEMPDDEVFGEQVADLAARFAHADGDKESDAASSRASRSILAFGEALHAFGSECRQLKADAFRDGSFGGVSSARLDRLLVHLEALRTSAEADGDQDVARFSRACFTFVSHVQDNRFLSDVRVVHILENANLTLQTVLQTGEADDYESLRQTVALLERPATLLGELFEKG